MKSLRILSVILLVALGVEMSAQSNKTHLYYNMGFPMGNTKDFISKASFRGMGFEYQYLFNNNFALGGVLQWSTFYQDEPRQTYVKDNGAINGIKYKYINTVPLYITGTYYLASDDASIRPYVGLGVGTYWLEQRTDMGLFTDIYNSWHFGLIPKAGVLIPISYSTSIYLGVDYNIAFKNSDLDQQSWIGLSVGFDFDY
jgi:outer membrane protein